MAVPMYVEDRYGRDRFRLIAQPEIAEERLEGGQASRFLWGMEFGEAWPEVEDDLPVTHDPHRAVTEGVWLRQSLEAALRREGVPRGERVGERHVLILLLRHGVHPLAGGVPMTLEAIAEALGITRERVRQLEMTAYKRVRGALIALAHKPIALPARVQAPVKLVVSSENAPIREVNTAFVRLATDVRAKGSRALTVREVLTLFGFKGRGALILQHIWEAMAREGVRCVPWIDTAGLTLDSLIQILPCVPTATEEESSQ